MDFSKFSQALFASRVSLVGNLSENWHKGKKKIYGRRVSHCFHLFGKMEMGVGEGKWDDLILEAIWLNFVSAHWAQMLSQELLLARGESRWPSVVSIPRSCGTMVAMTWDARALLPYVWYSLACLRSSMAAVSGRRWIKGRERVVTVGSEAGVSHGWSIIWGPLLQQLTQRADYFPVYT